MSNSGSWRFGSICQKHSSMFDLFWYSSLESLFWPLPGPRGLWSELAQARNAGWDEGWGTGLTVLVDGLWTFLLDTTWRGGVDPAAVDMDCAMPMLSSGGRKFSFWWTESDCHVTKKSSPGLLWLKEASAFKSAFHYFRPFSQIRDLKWWQQWITLYEKYTLQLRWINVKQQRNQ